MHRGGQGGESWHSLAEFRNDNEGTVFGEIASNFIREEQRRGPPADKASVPPCGDERRSTLYLYPGLEVNLNQKFEEDPWEYIVFRNGGSFLNQSDWYKELWQDSVPVATINKPIEGIVAGGRWRASRTREIFKGPLELPYGFKNQHHINMTAKGWSPKSLTASTDFKSNIDEEIIYVQKKKNGLWYFSLTMPRAGCSSEMSEYSRAQDDYMGMHAVAKKSDDMIKNASGVGLRKLSMAIDRLTQLTTGESPEDLMQFHAPSYVLFKIERSTMRVPTLMDTVKSTASRIDHSNYNLSNHEIQTELSNKVKLILHNPLNAIEGVTKSGESSWTYSSDFFKVYNMLKNLENLVFGKYAPICSQWIKFTVQGNEDYYFFQVDTGYYTKKEPNSWKHYVRSDTDAGKQEVVDGLTINLLWQDQESLEWIFNNMYKVTEEEAAQAAQAAAEAEEAAEQAAAQALEDIDDAQAAEQALALAQAAAQAQEAAAQAQEAAAAWFPPGQAGPNVMEIFKIGNQRAIDLDKYMSELYTGIADKYLGVSTSTGNGVSEKQITFGEKVKYLSSVFYSAPQTVQGTPPWTAVEKLYDSVDGWETWHEWRETRRQFLKEYLYYKSDFCSKRWVDGVQWIFDKTKDEKEELRKISKGSGTAYGRAGWWELAEVYRRNVKKSCFLSTDETVNFVMHLLWGEGEVSGTTDYLELIIKKISDTEEYLNYLVNAFIYNNSLLSCSSPDFGPLRNSEMPYIPHDFILRFFIHINNMYSHVKTHL